MSRLLDVDQVIPLWAPSQVGNVAFARWLTRYLRMGAGVGGAAEIAARLLETDLRETLPHVAVPTLVLHRRGDRAVNPGNASYLAERIPHARLVLLSGDDAVLWAGDIDPIAAEIDLWQRSLANDLDTPPTARPRPADPSKT